MKTTLALIVVLLLIAVGAFAYLRRPETPAAAPAATSTAPAYDSTISDGTITIGYPAPEFGLAVTREQLPASYIPACDEGFAYCVYYAGHAYDGTNFESAGVGISRRDDLGDRASCSTTPPDGYDALEPKVASTSGYVAATFAPVGDAGAGHYAQGAVYRLAVADRCYEIETRIGESQFANYEPGAIREFAVADRAALESEMRRIVEAITLPSGAHPAFPSAK